MLARLRGVQVALAHARHAANAQTVRAAGFHAGMLRRDEEKTGNPVVAGIEVPPRAPPAPPGILDRFGLGDWKVSVPIAVALGVPLLTKGAYVLSEETELAACFFLFCTLGYKYGSEMLASYFDARADAMVAEQNAAEDANIELAKETLKTHESMLTIRDDMTALSEAHKEAVALMCQVEAFKLRHKTRDIFVQNLEAIHRIEQNYNMELKRAMIAASTKKVRAIIEKGDISMKASAFKNALNVLGEVAESGKKKEDKVVELFVTELHRFAKDLEAKEGQVFKLTPEEQTELQDELDAYMKRYHLEEAEFKAPSQITLTLP